MKTKHIAQFILLLSFFLTGCNVQNVLQVPTATSTSTYTPHPTNTPLPTSTSTPAPKTQLEKSANGIWIFNDKEAGYQFQFGEKWYLEDVSNLDLVEILERTNHLRTELKIENTPQYFIEPEGMRILGVYTDDTAIDYTAIAFNTSIIVDEGFAQMSIDEIQQRVIASLANHYGFDPQSIDTYLGTNQNNVEYGVVLFNLALNYFQMRLFFKLDKGFGMVTLGFSDNNVDILGPDWALLTSSLQYMNP